MEVPSSNALAQAIFASMVVIAVGTPASAETLLNAQSPKPILDAKLLRPTQQFVQTEDSDDQHLFTFQGKETQKRRTLYGASLYAVDLDVSVALKPKRLMSLDAVW